MKGVMFNVVEEVVAAAYGPQVWEALLDKAGVDGVYTSLGSYPDVELVKLVGAAAETTGMATPALLKLLGRMALPRLKVRYPGFFTQLGDARSFILGLNGIIHPEVRKLYAGAGCPHFHFTQGERELVLGYNSPRKLCHLAEGLAAGVADHYGEAVTVSQTDCMHDGHPACHIVVRWP